MKKGDRTKLSIKNYLDISNEEKSRKGDKDRRKREKKTEDGRPDEKMEKLKTPDEMRIEETI